MSDDNPFGEPDETEKTVIRPSPGGRRAAPPERTVAPDTGREAPYGPADPTVAAVLARSGLNPLVAAAAVLLGLATRVRGTATQKDVEGLRDRVVRELKSFEAAASATGLPRELVRTAHYALSATIDDLVLSTPWGSQSSWPKRSMVSTFHNEVVGGERFYEILNQLHKNPGNNADVLELMYICLALGFEGRLRVTDRGIVRAQPRARGRLSHPARAARRFRARSVAALARPRGRPSAADLLHPGLGDRRGDGRRPHADVHGLHLRAERRLRYGRPAGRPAAGRHRGPVPDQSLRRRPRRRRWCRTCSRSSWTRRSRKVWSPSTRMRSASSSASAGRACSLRAATSSTRSSCRSCSASARPWKPSRATPSSPGIRTTCRSRSRCASRRTTTCPSRAPRP